MFRIRPRFLALSLLLASSALLAQPQAASPTASSTTITAVTRLVNIELVVRDSSGNPVHGLTAKDFTVKEDGKPQQLDLFEDRSLPAPADSYHSPATATPGRPNEFSNIPASGTSDAAVNIILFDLADTPQLDQVYAAHQLIQFCKSLPPGHHVALFLLTTRLHMVQDLTGSSDDLVAAASRIQAKEETLLRSKDEKMQTADILANWEIAIGRPNSFIQRLKDEIASEDIRDLVQRARLVNDAFAQIARATAGYSGRKNLLWLAEDFPVGFTPSLQIDTGVPDHGTGYVNVRDTANLIASSQISVFPIALSGIATEGVSAAMSGSSAAGAKYGETLQNQFNERRALYDTMNDVARETGGKAFYGTNDFAGALHEVVAQDAEEYTLAYRPTNANWDGRYRKISVQTNGRRYSLSYRRGYCATPEGGASVRAEMGDAMQLKNSLDATQLRLRADLVPSQLGEKTVSIDTTVDASDLTYVTDSAGLRHAQILVALLAAPAPGAKASQTDPGALVPATQTSTALNIDLDPTQYADLLRSGLHFRQQLPLLTGSYRLRIGVAQTGTHRFGTLMIPVTIP
jgi:VWFA-related protein